MTLKSKLCSDSYFLARKCSALTDKGRELHKTDIYG